MIRCPRCGVFHTSIPQQCACGFQLDGVEPQQLGTWFEEIRRILETSYLVAETSWQQSGKSGTVEDWTRARQPISRCIEHGGTILDIGCANGFLLECLLEWTPYSLFPYGLDFSPPLIELAKARLERYQNNFFVGNAWDWQPLCRFDYVRTELETVLSTTG